MSSDNRNRDNMDADSGDEVSEVEETSDEQLLAIGNDPQQERDGAAGFEEETSATPRTEERSTSYGQETGKKCFCNSSSQTRFKAFGVLQMQCKLCGGVMNGSRTNLAELNKRAASRAGVEGPVIGVVSQSYAASLPVLPSVSLEDNSSEQDGGSCSSLRSASLVTGRVKEEKMPVQNFCELSVQTPTPGMKVIMFLFEKTHQERNEKWYILYMIPEMEYKVYETIYKSHMDEANDATSQQGYITRQIPFAVDNARSQEFHTMYVQEQITVSFQIQNQWQENFVTRDAGQKHVFTVPAIHCQSKTRVAPGANSRFRVEYVGGPGKLCQEQGKITLTVDSTTQCTLFFSTAIWVPDG